MSKSLYKHFIRGYFDGDGCITKNGRTSLCAYNKEVLETILLCLPKKERTIYKDKRNGVYSFQYGLKDSKELLNYLYKDCNIYLNRKFVLYTKFCRSEEKSLDYDCGIKQGGCES